LYELYETTLSKGSRVLEGRDKGRNSQSGEYVYITNMCRTSNRMIMMVMVIMIMIMIMIMMMMMMMMIIVYSIILSVDYM
jgi:hypothetical protein